MIALCTDNTYCSTWRQLMQSAMHRNNQNVPCMRQTLFPVSVRGRRHGQLLDGLGRVTWQQG